MNRKEKFQSMKADAAKIVGCTLTDINVRTYIVEFLLSDKESFTLRVKKTFNFWIDGDEESRFDADSENHDPSIESAEFIFLRGRKCLEVGLSDSKFELGFEGGAKLIVNLSVQDFEPLELIGTRGDRHEIMDFYHVL